MVRPQLLNSGFTEGELEEIDAEMEVALRLTARSKPRKAYLDSGRKLRRALQELDIAREMRMGAGPTKEADSAQTAMDARILQALEQILPATALGYEQALIDLEDPDRISYRGVANELREVLRDVLDHYAPDDELTGANVARDPQHGFTQKQKVRYVLRQRGLTENAREAPERVVELIEAATASLTRATSVRASISAHVSSGRGEARQLKMYTEVVLAELLSLHAR